jgi:DNA-binding transcriptional MerR regulator
MLSSGEFARRSRLSPKALRLYDRIGLLRPAEVDPVNGYRRYGEGQLATARLVVHLRRLDMPLVEVARVISVPDEQGAELLAAYWAAVENRIAAQRELAAHLRIVLSGAEGRFDMYEIEERDVPEQFVLTEQRHIKVPELSAWVDAAIGRVDQSTQPYGGAAAAPFVIFHGEVNEDSDGPVEVCVPVDLGGAEPPNVPGRVEPAHREAYVRLTKAQVEYPQILSAYDAVEQWITSQGREIAHSPREVYFTDFHAAQPGDEVCDVAFPLR